MSRTSALLTALLLDDIVRLAYNTNRDWIRDRTVTKTVTKKRGRIQ